MCFAIVYNKWVSSCLKMVQLTLQLAIACLLVCRSRESLVNSLWHILEDTRIKKLYNLNVNESVLELERYKMSKGHRICDL